MLCLKENSPNFTFEMMGPELTAALQEWVPDTGCDGVPWKYQHRAQQLQKYPKGVVKAHRKLTVKAENILWHCIVCRSPSLWTMYTTEPLHQAGILSELVNSRSGTASVLQKTASKGSAVWGQDDLSGCDGFKSHMACRRLMALMEARLKSKFPMIESSQWKDTPEARILHGFTCGMSKYFKEKSIWGY